LSPQLNMINDGQWHKYVYNRLRVITHNVFEGMRLDTSAGKPIFVKWVKQMDPDVLALQEVTGFTQASLEKLAESYGHSYALLLINTPL
jgi:exodeoxyribonuclease III